MDFSQVTSPNDRVAVIATQPLTDNEDWIYMQPGTLWMFYDGEVDGHLGTVSSPINSPGGD